MSRNVTVHIAKEIIELLHLSLLIAVWEVCDHVLNNVLCGISQQ